jgi:hypothetical protein
VSAPEVGDRDERAAGREREQRPRQDACPLDETGKPRRVVVGAPERDQRRSRDDGGNGREPGGKGGERQAQPHAAPRELIDTLGRDAGAHRGLVVREAQQGSGEVSSRAVGADRRPIRPELDEPPVVRPERGLTFATNGDRWGTWSGLGELRRPRT